MILKWSYVQRGMNILTMSTSEFNAIDSAENHGGKSTAAMENIKRKVRSSISHQFLMYQKWVVLIFSSL